MERKPYHEFYLGERMIGKVVGDNLIIERWSKPHFYIKGGGYPINNGLVLRQCKEWGIKSVVLLEHRTDGTVRKYTCLLEKYLNAVLIEEPPFEQQRCVPLKEMQQVAS